MLERVDSRVLGAVRFVSAATGLPLAEPLRARARGAALLRKGGGLWVVRQAPGLETHALAFEAAPPAPPAGAVALALDAWDPAGVWLARRVVLRLPRDPDPAAVAAPGSLFQAEPVRMFPSPAMPVAPTWAVLRVTVRRAFDARRLAGALVRVVPADDAARIGRGLTDAAGEALVALAGVPRLVAGGDGEAVLANAVEAIVEVVVDPAVARAVADADVLAERRRALGAQRDFPDPDALEARRLELDRTQRSLTIAAGRTQSISVVMP